MPRRYNYLQPIFVVVFFLIVMTLPGGQRSLWNSVRPTASAASTFTVNSTGDGADSDITDGSCNDGTGACTLRAAMQEANAATPGPNTINFNLPASSVITLATALPIISGDLNINGPGANTLTVTRSTAVGTPRFRILAVDNPSIAITVNISGLTISNGYTLDGANGADGGGLWNGLETVNLTGVVISGNRTGAGSPGSGGLGGGISNFGTMSVANSTIAANTTGASGVDPGAFGGYGGGIYNSGTLTLTNSTITGNTTGSGPSPTNGGYGGAIFNTISRTVTLVNCTVSGNQTASGGLGGGIRNEGTANLKDTIVANNIVNGGGSGPDLSGAFVSQDFNLIEDVTSASFSGTTTHNLTGVDPLLGTLALNGGTTPTLALLFGSPAIDAGNTNQSFDQRGQPRPIDDQTVANAAGGNAGDIGAYEAHTLQVNSTADTSDGACTLTGVGNGCTLREAITAANAENGAELITFAPALTSGGTATITLLSALPVLSSDMTIAGPGASLLTIERSTVVGTPEFRIFTINSAKVIGISALTISNGRVSGASPANRGGNILSDHGILTITNCTIKNASGLGAIFNLSGTLVIDDSLITANASGGVTNFVPQSNPAANPASVTINRTTISGNTGVAVNNTITIGAAVSPATVTINNSTISGNNVDLAGSAAGIANGVGTGGTAIVTVNNSTIANNTNFSGTGGVYNAAVFNNNSTPTIASVRLNNSTVVNNSSGGAAGTAGGILTFLSSCPGCDGSVKLANTIVAGNFLNGATPSDIAGSVDSSSSFNLIGNGSGGLTNGVNGNQVGVDARVGALANNGGPTQTCALLPGSPAIDAGSNANAAGFTTDQRGFNRIVNTTVDIGAFESRGFTIAATSGSGQSRSVNLTFPSPLVATVSSPFGEPVAGGLVLFSFPLSGPSGTFSGGSSTATVTISSLGKATTPEFSANTLAGSYGVSAAVYGSSTSTSFSLTNLKGDTSTAITSSANPSDFGETVTFTATVTSIGGVPTGTVQFRDGPNLFGSPVTCVAGLGHTCTAQTSATFSVGTRSMSAEYSGDANFLGSVSLPFSQTINAPPSLSINDVSIAEGDSGTKTANFTVTLSASSHLQVNVNYVTASNTATPFLDYQATAGTLTFAPGDTTKTISITINGDPDFEADETYFVNLSTPVNATIGDSQGLGTIQNDDPRGGYLKFPSANFVNDENAGQTVISVNRIGDTSQAVTVDYATSDNGPLVPCGTINSFASSRCDYTTALGTLKFGAGETSKTFVVLISQDNYVEGSESLTITLSNPTGGAQLASPSTATLTITDDPFEPQGNPVDNPDVFVRQHYHDFLNREPDAPGLAFWSNQITECFNPAANCDPEVRRINVSAAFFLSIEFQETGYLVERLYKTAYGDADGTSTLGGTAHTIKVPIVRFNEFLRDSQQISKGVIVGVGDWKTVLEANKVAFTQNFVLRTRFQNAYPLTMTPAEFVDALFLKAGIVPSADERNSIIDEFGGGGSSNTGARARAIRRIAENAALVQLEKNKAFVLMQFFGYLRRNPDDPQDTNYSGYEFWLQKLIEHNGNYIEAEMVRAFIVSSEYRNRFGN